MRSTLAILADDLTGGCDTGSLFAGRAPVPLTIWPRSAAAGPIQVIDTESRTLGGREAAERVGSAAAAAPAARVFKKIDSTLRGRIGAETEALMAACRISRALLCPAFPGQGRTVVDRVLRIDGIPVTQTAISRDPEFPAAPPTARLATDVVELLGPQFERPLVWLPLELVRQGPARIRTRLAELTEAIAVADAETDEDLDALASAALDGSPALLLVGAAGLARPLAQRMGVLAERVPLPRRHRWLIVAGSRHPVTRRQIAVARAAGLRVIASPDSDHPGAVRRMADDARRLIDGGDVDLVAVTGGETAVALFEALGAERVDLVGAPRTGLALGYLRAPRHPALAVLTKAGGFGTDDLLVSLVDEAMATEAAP